MDFLKGSFKLQKPIRLESDSKREELLRKLQFANIVGGIFFIGIGLYKIFEKLMPQLSIFSHSESPGLIGLVVMPAILIIMIYAVSVRFKAARYDLAPKDEYEYSLVQSRYAKSYGFLSASVLFIIIFGSNTSKIPVIGLLCVAYGIAMVLDSKVNGYGPKKTT